MQKQKQNASRQLIEHVGVMGTSILLTAPPRPGKGSIFESPGQTRGYWTTSASMEKARRPAKAARGGFGQRAKRTSGPWIVLVGLGQTKPLLKQNLGTRNSSVFGTPLCVFWAFIEPFRRRCASGVLNSARPRFHGSNMRFVGPISAFRFLRTQMNQRKAGAGDAHAAVFFGPAQEGRRKRRAGGFS